MRISHLLSRSTSREIAERASTTRRAKLRDVSLDDTTIDREIRRLALPALGALIAEPLLIAIDSAMVGHLGTQALAGLSLASTILTTVVGLCIFLAYATTAATARLVGAGDLRSALRNGVDGMWLGLILGVVLSGCLVTWAGPILEIFNPQEAVLGHAVAYLRASALGLPGMLTVLAATGALRGLGDTRTPFIATLAGAVVNVPANYALIYVADWGIAGAGVGTAVAQTFMAAILVACLARELRSHHVSPRLSGIGVLRSLRQSGPLILRTVSLRAAILLQIATSTSLGTVALASNQVTMTVWNFSAYGLDALATAAQILVGQSLGKKDPARVRTVLARCLNRGLLYGSIVALALFALSWFIPTLISTDPAVRTLATQCLWITAIALPIASVAYMLDGVLIGAGDTKRLAWYMVFALAIFAPCATALLVWGSGSESQIWLWVAYAIVFMAARAFAMYRRVQGDTWMGIS